MGSAGLSVEVYERAPALEPLGAGLSLWANALRTLEGLGLGETVHAWHLPHFAEGRSGLRRSDGEMLVPISPAGLAERFGVLSVGVHRAVLQEALLDPLGREHLYLGRTCTVVDFDLARLTPGETWARGARFGQVPLADGRTYWFAARNAPEGVCSPVGEQVELRETFSGCRERSGNFLRGGLPGPAGSALLTLSTSPTNKESRAYACPYRPTRKKDRR